MKNTELTRSWKAVLTKLNIITLLSLVLLVVAVFSTFKDKIENPQAESSLLENQTTQQQNTTHTTHNSCKKVGCSGKCFGCVLTAFILLKMFGG